ncbi:MAG: PilZ domain-containing protein [Nitrospiria bacterium]
MEKERRGFVRVSTDCPIVFRVISPGTSREIIRDRFDHISAIETQHITEKLHARGDREENHTIELLLWLDWKMNYLIKTLIQKNGESLFKNEAVMVDLSATGMRFSTAHMEQPGTVLQFKFILPILPFKELLLEGRVTRSREKELKEETSARFEIAVAFIHIKTTDQEDLFHYIAKREMQIRYEQLSEEESKPSIS